MMEIDLLGWPTYFDHEGHLLDEYKLRKTAFFSGISNDVRLNAWPFLLNLWDRDSSSINRHHANNKLLKQYENIRNGWINAVPELFDKEMKQSIKTIGKDVRRTDRQHPFYAEDDSEGLRMLRRILITLSVFDTELAYVQGMNELISPILFTLREEHLTFWAFVKLLPMLHDRLLTLDLSPQLSATADLLQHIDEGLYRHIEHLTGGHWLFCFRWYLLLFKNEFKMDDVLKLWDVMFAQHNTSHFEIFVAVSILLMHREQVGACSTSDQLLHFAQSITTKLSVDSVISHARDLSVKLANTEGLSDNLIALIKQANKVPPPLVGFVRRRQCFKNIYSGRANMNDDLIKSLMGGRITSTPQNTPLFFSCTESPVPVPSANFLSGIQGATPLALAEKPELAPPPTNATFGVSPMSNKSRMIRPDALYKDSMSANPANIIDQQSYHQTIDGSFQFYEESASPDYPQQNSGYVYDNQAHDAALPECNYVEQTTNANEQSNQYYNNYNQTADVYQQHHYDNQQAHDVQQQQHHYNQQQTHTYHDNGSYQGQYEGYYDNSWIDADQSNTQSAINSHNFQHTSPVLHQQVESPTGHGNAVQYSQHSPQQTEPVTTNESSTDTANGETDAALNTISDDFWDMRISVHADDALS